MSTVRKNMKIKNFFIRDKAPKKQPFIKFYREIRLTFHRNQLLVATSVHLTNYGLGYWLQSNYTKIAVPAYHRQTVRLNY